MNWFLLENSSDNRSENHWAGIIVYFESLLPPREDCRERSRRSLQQDVPEHIGGHE